MSGDSDPIEVVGYDQRWVALFAVAERELRVALAPFLIEIEHIGSTAVPGLAAKPVIDIQVGVRTLDDSVAIVSAVESRLRVRSRVRRRDAGSALLPALG